MQAFTKRALASITINVVEQIQVISGLLTKSGLFSGLASKVEEKLNRIRNNAVQALKDNSKQAVAALISEKSARAELTISQEDYNNSLDETQEK